MEKRINYAVRAETTDRKNLTQEKIKDNFFSRLLKLTEIPGYLAVTDPALSLLWLNFDPCLRNFQVLQVWQKLPQLINF